MAIAGIEKLTDKERIIIEIKMELLNITKELKTIYLHISAKIQNLFQELETAVGKQISKILHQLDELGGLQ